MARTKIAEARGILRGAERRFVAYAEDGSFVVYDEVRFDGKWERCGFTYFDTAREAVDEVMTAAHRLTGNTSFKAIACF